MRKPHLVHGADFVGGEFHLPGDRDPYIMSDNFTEGELCVALYFRLHKLYILYAPRSVGCNCARWPRDCITRAATTTTAISSHSLSLSHSLNGRTDVCARPTWWPFEDDQRRRQRRTESLRWVCSTKKHIFKSVRCHAIMLMPYTHSGRWRAPHPHTFESRSCCEFVRVCCRRVCVCGGTMCVGCRHRRALAAGRRHTPSSYYALLRSLRVARALAKKRRNIGINIRTVCTQRAKPYIPI